MSVFEFYAHVAAVLVGNAFTVLVVYFFWRARNAERQGRPASSLPFGLFVAVLIPIGIVILTAANL